jgi:ectoine hydroxylase-related dioxygenase (phytanoyl-CoA dioxygenase family)
MLTHKICYDTERFDFRRLVQKHYGVEDLSRLDKILDKEVPFFSDKTFDQSTDIHKHFYKIYDNDEFLSLYQQFLKEVIQPGFGESIVYQAKPTFRIHLPNNVAVGEWHKDGDYNHQRTEINYWLPFTRAFGNNTIWIESEEDKEDYQSYDVEYGEVLVFNGAFLKHGNKPNDTGVCRVSIDFRIIPYSQYHAVQAESSHVKLKFEIGSYYNLLEV